MARNGRRLTVSTASDSARRAAAPDEQARFNAACARRGPAPLQTEAGLRLVWRVTPDWWYICGPERTAARSTPGRNDQVWAALMAWVGGPREPVLSKRPMRSSGNGRL